MSDSKIDLPKQYKYSVLVVISNDVLFKFVFFSLSLSSASAFFPFPCSPVSNNLPVFLVTKVRWHVLIVLAEIGWAYKPGGRLS